MKRFLKTVFRRGVQVAPVPLVFLSVAMVTAVQIPAHLLMRAGVISVGILANEVVAVAGIPLILILSLKMDRARLLHLGRPAGVTVALALLLILGADVIIDYMTAASEHFFPLPEGIKQALDQLMAVKSSGGLLWKFFLLCVVPGICEEIFFRGFCQSSLAASWGYRKAIIGVAVIFAILHGNPWYVHLYFVLGLVLGWVYAVTGSLWAPIVCHTFNNAWTFFAHVMGIKFPIHDSFGLPDVAILVAAALMFLCAAIFLRNRHFLSRLVSKRCSMV